MAFWCTGAAALSFAPLVPIGTVIMSGGGRTVGTWGLVVLALYGLAVVIVGAYPVREDQEPGTVRRAVNRARLLRRAAGRCGRPEHWAGGGRRT